MRSLSELICDDLNQLANPESDFIASEESIRFMMTMFKNQGKLGNVTFIHKNSLLSYLKSLSENSSLMSKTGHLQFIIEVGQRSKLKQGDPDTIHYCALDLFIRPGKQSLCFVADHYRGYDGFYTEFAPIVTELGFKFIVAGGSTYQADAVHCPIFTLNHLMLTAFDETLLPLLEKEISSSAEISSSNEALLPLLKKEVKEKITLLKWNKLSPDYMLLSQSVNSLFKFVDEKKSEEKSGKEKPSTVLVASNFDKKLSATLFPILSLDLKLRNKAVRYTAPDDRGRDY